MIKMNMKNYLIIGIILLFPFRLFADEPVKAIYAKITNPDNKEVTVVAHRADWRFAPENSLAAIESSIRLGEFYPVGSRRRGVGRSENQRRTVDPYA